MWGRPRPTAPGPQGWRGPRSGTATSRSASVTGRWGAARTCWWWVPMIPLLIVLSTVVTLADHGLLATPHQAASAAPPLQRGCRPLPAPPAAAARTAGPAPPQRCAAGGADRARRPDQPRLAAGDRGLLRQATQGRAAQPGLPVVCGVRRPARAGHPWSASPAPPTATSWPWSPPTWPPPQPSWSNALPTAGRSRSCSKRAGRSPGSARPATAPPARSSALSRSACCARAWSSAGTPSTASSRRPCRPPRPCALVSHQAHRLAG